MCPANYRRRSTGVVHGTPSGYTYHRCRCDACREAQRVTSKRRRTNRLAPARVDPTGTRRRVQALQAIGWGRKDLARQLGYASPDHSSLSEFGRRRTVHRDFANQVAELYDQLSMHPGPSSSVRIRARNRGYLPPLAWDDPDTDPEPPATSGNADAEVDEVAITRAMSGRMSAGQLRVEERRTVVDRLAQAGHTTHDIANRTGADWNTVKRDRKALEKRHQRDRRAAS